MLRKTGKLSRYHAPETPQPPMRDFMCEGAYYRVVEASYIDDDHTRTLVKFMNLDMKIYAIGAYTSADGKRSTTDKLRRIEPSPTYVDPAQIKEIIDWDFR